MEQVKYLELEIAELRKLLVECELQLRIKSDMVMRLQREPLTEERVYALYRGSLDWRVLARDVEAEHGGNPVGEI